jgi:hypothetical protein
MKALRVAIASLVFGLVACSGPEPTLPTVAASSGGGSGTVTVTAANPDSAAQDTTLDVHVLGGGFDRGSNAQWAQSGVISPNVKTNSTQFVSSGELVANITIAMSATTGSYDIVVTTSKGKKGIGSELFTIKKRTGPPTPANPQIAFWNGGNLQVMNVDGSNVTTLVSFAAGTRGPSWSPTGDGSAANPYHLVFEQGAGTCTLAILDVDSVGGAVHATNYHQVPAPGYACAPSWSPVGTEVSYGGWQNGPSPSQVGPSPLFVIPTGGGTPTALYTPPVGSAVFYSTWRSDGSAIAFTETDNTTYVVRVLNRTTGAVTTVVAGGAFVDVHELSWAHSGDLLAMCVHRLLRNKFLSQEVDTIRLARDVSGNYIPGGSPGSLTGGCSPSWSPNDARIAVDGIRVYDLLTGSTESLPNGSKPDWRRF